MCEEGRARAQPGRVWVLPAATSGPGPGELRGCSSVPLAAGTVKHYQAHSCAFLPLGLPQEGCGCGGQAAGARECSGQCFLLSGGQMFSLLCGMSSCPQHSGALTCSLELSNGAVTGAVPRCRWSLTSFRECRNKLGMMG